MCLMGLSLVTACSTVTPQPIHTPSDPGGQVFSLLSTGLVTDYLLKVQDQFKIQSVSAEHRPDVDKAVASFEADLAAGQLVDYYQSPGFTIKLSAGSEGASLSAGSEGASLSAGSEGASFDGEIKTLSERGAVFAQAVVYNDNSATPEIFKGQFYEGRFYFNQGEGQRISPLNTTYLLTLDVNLETEVFQGQLSAGSEGASLSAGSEGASLSAGSEGASLSPVETTLLNEKLRNDNLTRYTAALNVTQRLSENYENEVRDLKFVPPFEPLDLFYTETFSRVIRAYEQEGKLELTKFRGLPTPLLYVGIQNMVDRLSQRWEADCGSPPPDSGQRYPQRTPEFTAVPTGFQSAELESVIAEIPELKVLLDEKLKLPPPQRWKNHQDFIEHLARFKADYPEIFEKHQWQDKFAPPDCVNPSAVDNFRFPNSQPLKPPAPKPQS